MKFMAEANVYKTFEEFVQQVGRKPLDDVSDIVEVEMNVDVKHTF